MLTAELVAFLQWFLWSVCLPTGAGGEDQKCLAVVSTVKGLCWIEVFSWIVVLGFSLERYKAWLWIQEI
jgi:hypothetical protein